MSMEVYETSILSAKIGLAAHNDLSGSIVCLRSSGMKGVVSFLTFFFSVTYEEMGRKFD